MPGTGFLSPCPICGGQGLLTFERGPSVEPCGDCAGTGRIYSDAGYRGLFTALLRERGVFLDADMRLLLVGLAALDRRLQVIEDTSREV